MEVIDSTNAHDVPTWPTRGDTIHGRAAGGTEIIGHGVSRLDGV